MREDNDEFRHYLPLLRRIIILVAVITAVPVILWTITAFVRTYVGPPKVPTFHQLAATASINAPVSNANADASARQQTASQQAKLAVPSSATADARAMATEARDSALAPKGPLLGDRAPESDANAPAASAVKPANTSMTLPIPRSADTPGGAPAATDDAAQNTGALAAATEPGDSMASATPLPGPIPLPRHRPRDLGTVRMADGAPANVPVPRPRPDAAGPATPSQPTSGSPLGFIQNLFKGSGE